MYSVFMRMVNSLIRIGGHPGLSGSLLGHVGRVLLISYYINSTFYLKKKNTQNNTTAIK